MILDIRLEEPLASWVEAEASANQVSPEDYVRQVLVSKQERGETSEKWQTINDRRITLIEKEYRTGLTPGEEAELEALQRAAARWAEPRDRQVLDHLERFRQAVKALPDEPDGE